MPVSPSHPWGKSSIPQAGPEPSNECQRTEKQGISTVTPATWPLLCRTFLTAEPAARASPAPLQSARALRAPSADSPAWACPPFPICWGPSSSSGAPSWASCRSWQPTLHPLLGSMELKKWEFDLAALLTEPSVAPTYSRWSQTHCTLWPSHPCWPPLPRNPASVLGPQGVHTH